MRVIKNLRDVIKNAIENSLGNRLMSAYDVLLENPDDIETVKKEVIEKVANGAYCTGKEIVATLEDLIRTDESVISWIHLTRLYGGIR